MTVDKLCASYLYKRDGTYYFSKHVPCNVIQHYSRDRIVICLRTKTVYKAMRSSQSILQRLEDYWLSLRLSSMPLPGQHLIMESQLKGKLERGVSGIRSLSSLSSATGIQINLGTAMPKSRSSIPLFWVEA